MLDVKFQEADEQNEFLIFLHHKGIKVTKKEVPKVLNVPKVPKVRISSNFSSRITLVHFTYHVVSLYSFIYCH